MGNTLDLYLLHQGQNRLDVNPRGREQGLTKTLSAKLRHGGRQIAALHVENLPHKGKTVGVYAA